MTTINPPKKPLVSYLDQSQTLEPVLPVKGWMSSEAFLRLRVTIARIYWGKRNNLEYLKVLCAALTIQLETKSLNLTLKDVVFAQADCKAITDNFVDLYNNIRFKVSTERFAGGMLTEYQAAQWCNYKDPTQAILSHIQTIWSLVTAMQVGVADKDEATLYTFGSIKREIPKWIAYLESIYLIANKR